MAPTTVQAITTSGSTIDLSLSGNITSTQINNATITQNQSAASTIVSFTVTGTSGTTGFGNITIPKTAVPYGTTPKIYIDGQQTQNQGYTQDSSNYYVWYTTHFSTHQISIVFASAPSGSKGATSTLGLVYGAVAGIAVVAIVIVALTLLINSRRDKGSQED